MSDSGSEACPPTKRKGAAGKEQQLANARMRKEQLKEQKQLLVELLEVADIKNPIPPHMQLLELCRLAETTTTEMSEIGGFRYDIMKEARKLYADDISKKPGFSQEELDLHESEVFKRFYGFATSQDERLWIPFSWSRLQFSSNKNSTSTGILIVLQTWKTFGSMSCWNAQN